MTKDVRTVSFDTDLQIEAYQFDGIVQRFPNHFHDYYVIGFIERGKRYLMCKNQEYIINPGDMVIFNPGDIHTCEQIEDSPLYYRSINIQPDILCKAVYEITGLDYKPYFTKNVIYQSELTNSLKELHGMILKAEKDFVKEELYLFLIGQLNQEIGDTNTESLLLNQDNEFKSVCEYLELNYSRTITLDELCKLEGLSKYHFLRSFTQKKGITPYSYLETIRISKAKKMLEQGVLPVKAALQTGFSDQSHFSNFFKRFIGLTPKQYMRIFMEHDQLEQLALKEDENDTSN